MIVPSWTTRLHNGDVTVLYRVEVGVQSPAGTTTKRAILRRYSEFRRLYLLLREAFPRKKLPTPPPKQRFSAFGGAGRDEAAAHERRAALEQWLWTLLGDVDISRCRAMGGFLELAPAARCCAAAALRWEVDEKELLAAAHSAALGEAPGADAGLATQRRSRDPTVALLVAAATSEEAMGAAARDRPGPTGRPDSTPGGPSSARADDGEQDWATVQRAARDDSRSLSETASSEASVSTTPPSLTIMEQAQARLAVAHVGSPASSVPAAFDQMQRALSGECTSRGGAASGRAPADDLAELGALAELDGLGSPNLKAAANGGGAGGSRTDPAGGGDHLRLHESSRARVRRALSAIRSRAATAEADVRMLADALGVANEEIARLREAAADGKSGAVNGTSVDRGDGRGETEAGGAFVEQAHAQGQAAELAAALQTAQQREAAASERVSALERRAVTAEERAAAIERRAVLAEENAQRQAAALAQELDEARAAASANATEKARVGAALADALSAKAVAEAAEATALEDKARTETSLAEALSAKATAEARVKAERKVLAGEVKSLRRAAEAHAGELQAAHAESAEARRERTALLEVYEQSCAAQAAAWKKTLKEVSALRERMAACGVERLAEEEAQSAPGGTDGAGGGAEGDESPPASAAPLVGGETDRNEELLSKSDMRIGVLLAEAQLIAEAAPAGPGGGPSANGEPNVGSAHSRELRDAESEVRKALAEVLTDNASLRRVQNGLMRHALQSAARGTAPLLNGDGVEATTPEQIGEGSGRTGRLGERAASMFGRLLAS